MRRILLSIITPVVLTGCMTVGKPFQSDLAWIKKEDTKKKDVKFVLGDPYQVGNSSGKETWTYSYYKYRLFSGVQSKELKFYWNPDSTLDRYTFTSSFPSDTKSAR